MDSLFWPHVLEYLVVLIMFIVTVLVVMFLVLIALRIYRDVKKDGVEHRADTTDE